MTFPEIIQLVVIYLSFAAGVFSVVYAPVALWRFFKRVSAPDYYRED